ncbi:MAG: MerR family transcriptional regulator [Bacillota bacterium]|nr:MerR family transcriptional regulator [Bacillota bacterium]
MYKVKEVAEIAGVSVRTLHHYDKIGLLHPGALTDAGYRLYSDENLEVLQQILFFKEIGLPLEEIKNILDRPDFDRKKTLEVHKELLLEKKLRIEKMLQTLDNTLQTLEGGRKMESKELFNGLSMKEIKEHQAKYADEVRDKYGKEMTENVDKKTSAYSETDWSDIQTTTNEIYYRIIANMAKGPDDAEVQTAVGEWRQLITERYYDCTLEIFRGLGDLYVADERFTKNLNKYHENFAPFLQEAIHHYCDQHKN